MMFPPIEIDQERLTAEIDKLATFSDAPAPAVTRILFTPTETAARAWLRQLIREAGLSLREDAVGNIFGRWAGPHPERAAVATGSHIDAIPHAGKYDGTVGVLGGLEAIRALRRAGHVPARPIELIMFTAEEPTRFGIGCVGSRALCGRLDASALAALTDADGRTFDAVRTEAGYTADLDTVALPTDHYHAFVELHIEQGPRLENADLDLGIVTAIAAPATLRVRVSGDGGHAGAVLMERRRDVLPAVAEMILAVERAAHATGRRDSVATVGTVDVHPGAVNSIPSEVTFQVDIRDTDLDARDGMVTAVQTAVETICAARRLQAAVTVLNADPPCRSDERIVHTAVDAARHLDHSHTRLVSRAYHDTLFMAQLCPSGMIFVPSHNGYSHRPEEYTPPHQIAAGTETLALALARLTAE